VIAAPSVRRWGLLLAVSLVPLAPLASQTMSGRAVIAVPKSSTRLPGLTDRLDGVWAGVALDVNVGRLAVSVSGTRGRLTAAEAGSAPDRDVGEIFVSGRYDVRPGLGFDLRYITRAFSSAAGYQRWDLGGVGATASRDLGTPAVRATISLAYLPVVKVSAQGRPAHAVSSEVGISVAPHRLPLALQMSYRVERFSFPKAAARSDQFEALTLSIGLVARRIRGRWTLGSPGK